MKQNDIVWHHATVTRERREKLNGHGGAVVWFTGLSGSGKSTIAHRVEEQLHRLGCHTYVFDGDNVRHGLCAGLGFSPQDRSENIRRIGEMVKLFLDAGILALTAFISPFTRDRRAVRDLIGPENFIEIHCRCPLDVCEQRDVKGMYKRARAGEIKDFTGISSPYENPVNADLVLDTDKLSIDECAERVIEILRQRGVVKSRASTAQQNDAKEARPMNHQEPRCRFCDAPLSLTFVDLGMSPFSNSYVAPEKANAMEPFYPLHTYVCTQCWLVQLQMYESSENIFSDYAYFSSYSDSWLAHAKAYTDKMGARFKLNASSQVIEIASNDGYLLQYFKEAGIPVLGVEPAKNVAEVAVAKGIPSVVSFFSEATARELVGDGIQADLLLGNNVLAHVPDLNDFVKGMKILLKATGVITMEFPHLQRLVDECQFDTIYHEHFSYFSFITVERVFARHGLAIFDVEELPTHGGSLRIYARHDDDATKPFGENVAKLREREQRLGYTSPELYRSFSEKVMAIKRNILEFMAQAKRQNKQIVGYGAPAKGNTLLNYCGIRTDMISYTVDRSPHKQGQLLPGTHIPIYSPDKIRETKPEYVVILPWNLKDEIVKQMAHIREWGGKFVVMIPEVKIIP